MLATFLPNLALESRANESTNRERKTHEMLQCQSVLLQFRLNGLFKQVNAQTFT